MGGASSKDSGIKNKYVKDCLRKFDPNELEVLHKIYKELSSRSLTSGIDKETFLQYFNLPGLWGEQLFRKFDINYSGAVELEEFLIGIAISCRGTRSEKIYVLFKLFDLNNDNLIQKFELLAMLSNFPQLTKYLYTSIDNADSRFNTRNRNFKILDRFYEHKNIKFNCVSSLYDNERNIIINEKYPKKYSPRKTSSNESVISRQTSFTDTSIFHRKDDYSRSMSTEKVSRSLSDFSHDSRTLTMYLTRNYEDVKNDTGMLNKLCSLSSERMKTRLLLKRSNSCSKEFNSNVLSELLNKNKNGYNPMECDMSNTTDHNDEIKDALSISDTSHGSWSDIELSDINKLAPHDDPSSVLVKSIIQEHMDHEDFEKSNIDLEILVDQILEECEFNQTGALCFKKFKAWLEKNDSILTMFSQCLHEEVWGLQGNAFHPDRNLHEPFLENKYDFNFKASSVEGPVLSDKYAMKTYDLDDITVRAIYHVFLVKGKPPFAYTLENNLNSYVSEELVDHINNINKSMTNGIELLNGSRDDGKITIYNNRSSDIFNKSAENLISKNKNKNKNKNVDNLNDNHLDNGFDKMLNKNKTNNKTTLNGNTNTNSTNNVNTNGYGTTSDQKRLESTDNVLYEIFSCPNCKTPFLMCPVCYKKHNALSLHIESNNIYIKCSECCSSNDNEIGVFKSCWICCWSFNEIFKLSAISKTTKVATTNPSLAASFMASSSDERLVSHANKNRGYFTSNGSISQSSDTDGGKISISKSVPKADASKQLDHKNGLLNVDDFTECKLRTKLSGDQATDSQSNSCTDSSSKLISFSATTKSGLMYKIGKTLHQWKSRYYVLIGNILYYYKDKASTRPKGCIFLEGCYLDTLRKRQIGNKYGFSICHKGNKYSKRDFYVESMKEFLEWIEALTHAMKQQTLSSMYDICEQLGQGKFSIVYRAICKVTGEEYAVKIIDKTKITHQERELLRSEISILKLLKHNNVIFLKDIIDMKDSLYIIMELVKGGELYDLIHSEHRLTEEHTHRIISQLLQTVAYLHKCGIIHRDLKPENLLLTDKSENASIKLTDFGLSTLCGPNDILTQPCGTLAYVAPEVLTMQGYNQKSDVWSIGVIMYLLIRGRLPFAIKKTHPIHIWDHYKVNFEGTIWRSISSSARDLIKKLLEIDPIRRISVFEALDHIWVKNFVAVNHDSPSIMNYNNLGESDEFYQSLRNTTDTTFVLPYSESCNRNLNKLHDVESTKIAVIPEKDSGNESDDKQRETQVSKLPTVHE